MVFFTNNLKPGKNSLKAAAKARSILATVKQNFNGIHERSFFLIYKTYIRPHLKYSIQLWSPYLNKDIECLKKVQRVATKLVPYLRSFDYEERPQKQRLTSLYNRRKRGDSIEAYKLSTGKVNVSKDQFFQLRSDGYNTIGHTLKLSVQRSRLDLQKYFFSQRVVQQWCLPQNVIDAPTFVAFKNRSDKSTDMGNKGNA